MKYLFIPLSSYAESSGIEPHAGISRTHDLAGRRYHRLALLSINKNKLSEHQVLVVRESLVSQLVIHQFIRNCDDCQAFLHGHNLTSYKNKVVVPVTFCRLT